MRHRARVDANQPDIVAVFRRHGFSVLHLHQIGHGCPDILIAKYGRSYLVEIKDGSQPFHKRKLTPDEEKFLLSWKGKAYVVCSVESAEELATSIEGECNGTGTHDEGDDSLHVEVGCPRRDAD